MLKVEHISSGYEKKQVLYDVSFEIEKGDIVTLVGSNGSGKSTLLKSLYGLLPLMNFGKLFFNCEDITGLQPHKIIEKGLLYVPQKNNIFPELSVLENLEVAGINLAKDELRSNLHKTLEIFKPLKLLINRMPTSLSGGEKQLLALSMANLYQPKMILFDEPFNGLSPKSIRLLQDYILELNNINGTTFLFAEHRIFESIKIANKIISLKLGKVFSQQKVLSDFNYQELIPIFI